MNTLTIPASPNWYEPSILACSWDNTLVYGTWNDIIIMENSLNYTLPAKVQLIPRAHSQKVVSIGINRNWGNPNKLIVSVGEDNIVKVWNAETLKKTVSHNCHANQSRVVGATFAGEERVISVSEEGIIVVWNISINETTVLKNVFGFKTEITCISTCPHATWLTAFGLKNGLVLIADLRRNGKLIHKLRGHDKAVISLAWCPVPINIFPRMPTNIVGVKKLKLESEEMQLNNSHSSNESTENVVTNQDNNESRPNFESLVVPDGSDNINNIETTLSTEKEFSFEKNTEQNEIVHIDTSVCSKDDSTTDCVKEDLLNVVDSICPKETNIEESLMDLNQIVNGNVNVSKEVDTTNNYVEKENTDVLEKNKLDQDQLINSSMNVSKEEDTANNSETSKTSEETNVPNINVEVPSEDKSADYVKEQTHDTEISESAEKINIFGKNMIDQEIVNTTVCESYKSDISELNSEKNDEKIPPAETFKPSEETNVPEKSSTDDISTVDVNIEVSSEDKTRDNAAEIVESSERINVLEKSTVDEEVKNTTACESNNLSTSELTSEKIGEEMVPAVTTKKREPLEEEPRKEFLLASSSREGNIYIWRAGTDGRMQTFFSVMSSVKPSSRKSQYKSEKNWFPLFWATPTKLLVSSRLSELLQWTLPKPKNKSKEMTVIHADHTSMIFNIVGPTILLNEYNWVNEPTLNVWTFGLDRLLLNTSLGPNRTNLASYPTFGGCVCCIQPSPLDPNRLALGTSDGYIRLWDLTLPHINKINMTVFYSKIKCKVESLAWHPFNESSLGFGTTEGRVGYIDTNNKSKAPHLYPQFFTKPVHKIEWGPIDGTTNNYGLYAVGEGRLVIFGTKSDKDYVEVDKPENTYIFSFAWKPDYSILLVITKTGSIITYSPDLTVRATFYCEPKMQWTLWQPDLGTTNWFANIINFKSLSVYDYEIFKSTENPQESLVAKYEGLFLINSFFWSPHDTNQMVIATDAGMAVVWDIKINKVISTYVNPCYESLLSVTWSPINPDLIIVASKENNVYIWEISTNPPREEKEVSNERRKVLSEITKETSDLLPNYKKDKESIEELPKPKKKVGEYLPSFYMIGNKQQGLQDLKILKQWIEQSSSEVVSDESLSEPHKPNMFDIFGSNANMINLVKMNENKHKERGKYSAQIGLSLMRGDISSALKEAIQQKRVTTQVLTLAPMVSPKLWLEACETYAEQLSQEADADPLQVVTYYLACHKVHEAINVLCQAMMFKEALALAKCRMMEGDRTITEVIEKWAKQLVYIGNFEMTAQCYIVLGRYEDAASILFRRSDPETLQFAAELAEKCEDKELHKAIMTRLNAFKDYTDNDEAQCTELSSTAKAVLRSLHINQSEEKLTENGTTNLPSETSVENVTIESEEKCTPSNTETLINVQVLHQDEDDLRLEVSNSNNIANLESICCHHKMSQET